MKRRGRYVSVPPLGNAQTVAPPIAASRKKLDVRPSHLRSSRRQA